MNIIEAIKSGKRFRRKSWTNRDYIDVNTKSLDLPLDAITSDDWEVEDKKVTITESQFDSAVSKLYDINSENWSTTFQFTQAIKKELGFTD